MTDLSSSFPGTGSLAQRLRKILYPDLTDNEVETITVCLMSHLLVESALNGLLFRWLQRDTAILGSTKALNEAEEVLWKQIVKMDFAKKYSLVKPFFAISFSEDAVADPWRINDLRNDIFHGRAIKDAKFKEKSICDESTVHDIFVAAQSTTRNLRQFEEMLNASHALGDGLKDRFEQLNKKVS
jgi:hypothetical protein